MKIDAIFKAVYGPILHELVFEGPRRKDFATFGEYLTAGAAHNKALGAAFHDADTFIRSLSSDEGDSPTKECPYCGGEGGFDPDCGEPVCSLCDGKGSVPDEEE